MSDFVVYEFESEPGLIIKGVEFKIKKRVVEVIDEELSVVRVKRSEGK